MRRVSQVGLVLALCALFPISALAQGAFKVIVRDDHEGTAIQKEQLAAIYLGQARRWASGGTIRPVDQSTQSAVRVAFSEEILDRTVEAAKSYWKRQILLGALRPPPVKQSDLDVIEYVSSKRGAIGYVTAATQLPASIKALELVE